MMKYICVLCLLMAVVFADNQRVDKNAAASSGNSGIELLDTAESANPDPQFFGGYGGYGGYGGEKIDAS